MNTQTKKRDLSHLTTRRHKIEIAPIPHNEGGGYEASIPELGRDTFCGHGVTEMDALESLMSAKWCLFKGYLNRGINAK